ncbi:MAG TPA: EAL domain-containing protein [Steroidobacteraceae bacterium]|nr:EAL domain-containing protein [Steroidobacteraceae bacterium]
MPRALKAAFIIACCITLIMSAISGAAHFYLLETYVSLERESAERTAAALRRAWQEEIAQLEGSVRNYAVWDDMYEFVHRPNIPFVQSSLAQTSMSNQWIDTVLVTDENAEPVFWRRYRDPGNRGFPDARVLIAELPEGALALPAGSTATPSLTGILPREGGAMLVSIAPILPTSAVAPARGNLLFGRALDGEVLARLSAAAGIDVAGHAPGAAELPAAVRAAAARRADGPEAMTVVEREDRTATHLIIPDIAGAPAIVLRVTEPRQVYLRGLETIDYLVYGAFVMCLVFGAIALVMWLRLTRHWAQRNETEARYRAVVAQATEGIVLVDPASLRILEANRAFLDNAGYDRQPETGLGLADVFPPGPVNTPALTAGLLPGDRPVELKLRTRGGRICDAEVTTSVITHQGRDVFCLVTRDVTARKAADARLRASERRLEHLAHHDPLTGLPNRLYLHSYLKRALDVSRDNGTPLALLFLDVDRFKFINDSRGHETGDALLKEVARRLKDAAGEGRLVVRMGGDEFVVVMPDAADSPAIEQLGNRILESLRQPFRFGDLQFLVTCSIGISVYPRDAADISMLVRSADTAMYHAKDRGRNNLQHYHATLIARVSDRVQLESRLRAAVDEERLQLVYQPQFDLRTGSVIGVEALLRWRDGNGERQLTDELLRIAEETGLIIRIGDWVIREACRVRRAWQAALTGEFRMAVNLSPSQLRRPEFLTQLQAVLAATGLDPALLEVELTESAFMQYAGDEARPLHCLRQSGIGVAVDDFGVGYSSLSYLKHFPVTKLKIDRSFVRDLATDPNDAAIVRAILALAHSMRIPVCAEGVESADQVEFLVEHGCEYAQGYFFAQPMDEESCLMLLSGTASGSVAVRLRTAPTSGQRRR